MRISFTYDVITEESAINGDYAESGFLYEEYEHGLKEALRLARDLGCSEPSQSYSDNCTHIYFSSIDPNINYQTGEHVYYSVHFSDIGEKTLKRICNYFGVKYESSN